MAASGRGAAKRLTLTAAGGWAQGIRGQRAARTSGQLRRQGRRARPRRGGRGRTAEQAVGGGGIGFFFDVEVGILKLEILLLHCRRRSPRARV